MQPPDPETPTTPSASNPRREMRSLLLSPSFSRGPFPAADVDHGGAVPDHPCVTLLEWWLAKVEGDDQKIAVAGIFEDERDQADMQLAPSPIAKRHSACVVETEDGVVLLLYGFFNGSRMHQNGYSIKVCEQFMIGFPYQWKSCNQLYPKETNYTGNTKKDSKQFDLELWQRFLLHGSTLMSKLTKSVKRMAPHKDAAFQKSSHFSNGASRFEEYTCDEERDEAVCNEANNVQIDLTAGRALRDGCDIENISLLGCKKTPVASLKSQGCQKKHQQIPSNEKPSAPKKQRSEPKKLQGRTRSPLTSPVPFDGTITGVMGLEPPSPKASEWRTYASRKKRKAQPVAASELKSEN